ncbi:hypothetical protein Tco_0682325 [Tanacetum coccineum]|uniref:Uncharacterized protein n=1 Tax=Tanacetum coccineum TaxID=301880 RepID=A0ABQ4XRX6_9ASTR
MEFSKTFKILSSHPMTIPTLLMLLKSHSLSNRTPMKIPRKSCGKGAHHGYNCPPKVQIIYNPRPCNNQTIDELPQTLPRFDPTCYSERENSLPYVPKPNFVDDSLNKEEEKRIEEEQAAKARYWKIPVCYDDDDDKERSIPLKDTIIYGLPPCVAITPALLTEEPVDSLIMDNEHLDTIPETESDEFIKSSVENHVQNPSESEDFSDIESECDMPVCDNFTTFSNLLFDANDDFSSSDDESFSDTIIESFLTFPILVEDSDSLREEIDIFPGPGDSIPPGIKSDDFDSEDDDNSTFLPEFESFHVDYPDSGDSTIDVVEDIPVDVPNILPTHPALHMDFDFIPSINDLGSDLSDSSPSGDRNKIYDSGICIEVKPTRFLVTLSPVIDTLILFSSENDDKVFNHGVLASKKKSPPSSSHRGLKASKFFHHKIPMLIHGDNTPNLGDFPDCDDSRARGFVLHSLEFHILSFILGIPIS